MITPTCVKLTHKNSQYMYVFSEGRRRCSIPWSGSKDQKLGSLDSNDHSAIEIYFNLCFQDFATWYNQSGNQFGGSSENWTYHYPRTPGHIYSEYAPTCNKDTCSTMFIAALFITARRWKESRCPSMEEWIQKMWCIYTMEYYSAIKNNEFMKFLGKWMDLEYLILSEVTQSQKNTHDMYSLING